MADELKEGDYVLVNRDHKEIPYETSYLKGGTRCKVIKSFYAQRAGLELITVQFSNGKIFELFRHEIKKETPLVRWLIIQEP